MVSVLPQLRMFPLVVAVECRVTWSISSSLLRKSERAKVRVTSPSPTIVTLPPTFGSVTPACADPITVSPVTITVPPLGSALTAAEIEVYAPGVCPVPSRYTVSAAQTQVISARNSSTAMMNLRMIDPSFFKIVSWASGSDKLKKTCAKKQSFSSLVKNARIA